MDDAINAPGESGDLADIALELEHDLRRLTSFSELICILGQAGEPVSPGVLFVIGEQMVFASEEIERAWMSILRSHRRPEPAPVTAP